MSAADIWIYGPIGGQYTDGISAKSIIDQLAGLPAATSRINVHVNSGGGDPFDRVAIAHALREERRARKRDVDVTIDGLAASAATIITCAGSSITMADGALMMIHLPWTITIGDADEHREAGGALDRVTESIVAVYQWVSRKSPEALRALMRETTWMDADEAIANGFATGKADAPAVAARVPPEIRARLGSVPAKYTGRMEKIAPSSSLNPVAVYAARARSMSAEGPPSTPRSAHSVAAHGRRRAPSMSQLATDYYGAASGAAPASSLLTSSARGGGQ